MLARADRSAVAREPAVSTRLFLRFALFPVSSCAARHGFSNAVDQYRTINGSRHGAGVLSGYG